MNNENRWLNWRMVVSVCLFLWLSQTSLKATGEAEIQSDDAFYVRVADTNCRVLIAQVNLEIGDLRLSETGKGVVGDYSLEVPLRSSKNEKGSMFLMLDRPIADYFLEGGVLHGTGKTPRKPDQERTIVCTVIPDDDIEGTGALILQIDTGRRVMCFKTTYAVSGSIPTPMLVGRNNY